jgi:hypothetical protein
VDSGNPGGDVEENRLKRCLKVGGGWSEALRGGGGFVLVWQGVSRTNILWKLIHDLEEKKC